MKSKHLIGFFGHKGAGKDTAAQALLDEVGRHRKSGRIYKFATPLKRMAAALMQEPVHMMNGDSEASRQFREEESEKIADITGGKIKTPRALLQWLGTELGRQLCRDIWVRLLEKEMGEDGADLLLVTDCRFENEMAFIKRHGGLCVWVKRPGLVGEDKHASEAFPFKEEDFDLTIYNTSTLNSFKETAGNTLFHKAVANKRAPVSVHPR